MIYNLYDELTNEEINIIDSSFQNAKCLNLSSPMLSNDNFNNIETINLFLKIQYNFLSEQAQSFFKTIIEKKINFCKINIFFIENRENNAKIAIDWINYLNETFNQNFTIKGEFDELNLSEEIIFIKQKPLQKNESNNQVIIYTDGACSGNPGAGGWGAILMHGANKKEISGFENETTNNRMELTAVIRALQILKAKCNVELYSDSAYVVNAISLGWLKNWKQNNWVGSDKKQVKNIELWKELDNLLSYHNVNFNKVKGHADNEFNNRCDQLATGEIAKNANK